MAVIIDMSKAYDRLEWGFINSVLERLGFHQTWRIWIMQCVTTVSYSYLLNDTAQGSIIPQRGIRQGDPLSPYLFILCSEVLSGLCNKVQLENKHTGINVKEKPPDQPPSFCRSDKQNCDALLEILKKYELASGQMINPLKSALTFSPKTPTTIKERIKLQLGIEKEGGLGKYLGLPELFGRKK